MAEKRYIVPSGRNSAPGGWRGLAMRAGHRGRPAGLDQPAICTGVHFLPMSRGTIGTLHQ